MSTDIDISMSKRKWSIHIEVRLKPRSTARFDTIRTRVSTWLHSFGRLNLSSTLSGWSDVPELDASVEKISTSDPPSGCSSASLPLDEMLLNIHVYQPSEGDDYQEFSNMGGDGAGDGDDTMAATVRELPCRAWEGLWESLIYEDDVKIKLLDYIQATLVFSDAEVDFNLVSWNRVVLLHGPPGTGKTSLCRALAQKLSIRLSERYSHGRLLEINSHSLFSKWFSESGKLVQRLFTSITELADEEEAFLVVLIDEVESLTAARAGAMAGTEPSDGLRVVNALLTQLDKLKHRKNVLIMSTSNLVRAIDSAFIDRADIVQYIDLPPREAIYEILRTCLAEIVKRGIVGLVTVPPLQKALMYERTHTSNSGNIDKERHLALRLLGLATVCRKQELSGRALRRLPVLAMARSLSGTSTLFSNGGGGMDPEAWLDGMERVVSEQGREKGKVQ
ncbi:thyroid receptor-interacting protein 13 [Moniliophthora roreri MCA 2997]|uniref:Thyroid receptor-interacting protein 13 n=2 Tax=Moniliophthora roreri TaxID=221103 RepID=V2XY60_MONRO|nr:thyroid receptor-interacting protein 13 [Moniliophthora roreri MCA 2997]